MRTNKKIFFFVIQLALIFVISGCEVPDARVNIALPSDKPQEQQPKQIEQRFHASTQQRLTAIESTIRLSKKYAKLAEENLRLKEKNRELIEENKGLKRHITPLSADLEQIRKELAESGTLFLDEISEMPPDLQAKLLRVLQEKTFRKVGGIKLITCKATIIASSNRNLKKEVEENKFRRDLYYRLNICPITLAPLKSPSRKDDIALLAEYFLETSTICPQKKGKIKSITKLAIEALQNHDWPGNVRELHNIIERAVLLETTDKIGMSNIIIDMDQYDEQAESNPLGHIKDFSLSNAERELICRALQKTGWQKTHTATLLGITRATLYAKVKQYNIEKGSYIAKGMENETQDIPSYEHITV